MRRPALVALALLSGCRLETPAPPSAGGAVPEPPVVAGDTAVVTPREAARATPPARPFATPSGLVVPVEGVRPSDLVDTFKQARGENRVHDAIDILAPRGTPVVAAAPGRVARLFTSERGGLTVYLVGDRPLGVGQHVVYYYAHLDAYAPGLAEGDRLRAGDPVGTVGDTGNAAPGNTHLHFAVWTVPDADDFWDGEPINPYDLLAR